MGQDSNGIQGSPYELAHHRSLFNGSLVKILCKLFYFFTEKLQSQSQINMEYRKSLRSAHFAKKPFQQQSRLSFKKIQLTDEDLVIERNNQHIQNANAIIKISQPTDNKYVPGQNNSILNKLLLQPPSLKNNPSSKKLPVQNGQNKKYEQKFQKPDIENLIQENVYLKSLLQSHNQQISILKIKNSELEKKLKALERGMHKIQINTNENDSQNQKENIDQKGPSYNEYSKRLQLPQKPFQQKNINTKTGQTPFEQQKTNLNQNSINTICYPTTGMVHTQILKKKIVDLTKMYSSAQNQLKTIKKLPVTTIYEQTDVEKQHLMAETIRLKAIITSLSSSQTSQPLLGSSTGNGNDEKFENQFMRLMKQENQKLKGTTRLLQNDKVLLKSRQSIQNKLNSDLKKEIEHLKQKLLYKESQLQKLNNQNKNLLFKKTSQFRQEQEKKENEQISELKLKLIKLESDNKKVEELNEYYATENTTLKEKEKSLLQEISEIEAKYEKLIKNLNDQIDELQFQLNHLKTDYYNAINTGSLKKKKSLGIAFSKTSTSAYGNSNTVYGASGNKSSSNRWQGHQQEIIPDYGQNDTLVQSELNGTNNNQNTFNRKFNESKSTSTGTFNNDAGVKKSKYKFGHNHFNSTNLSNASNATNYNFHSVPEAYYRPVKWEDINLAMLHVYSVLQANPSLSINDLIASVEDQNQQMIKCIDLITMFVDQPFNLSKDQATKLSRYIVEDTSSTEPNAKELYNENKCITAQLGRTILSCCLNKIEEKSSLEYVKNWQLILEKTKKLTQWVEDDLNNYRLIGSENIFEGQHDQKGNAVENTQNNNFEGIISRYELIKIFQKYSRKKISLQEYEWLIIQTFQKQSSESQVFVSKDKVISLLKSLRQKHITVKNGQNSSIKQASHE